MNDLVAKCLIENATSYNRPKQIIAEETAKFIQYNANGPIGLLPLLKSKLGLADTFKNSIYVGKLLRQVVDEAKASAETHRLADTIVEDDDQTT